MYQCPQCLRGPGSELGRLKLCDFEALIQLLTHPELGPESTADSLGSQRLLGPSLSWLAGVGKVSSPKRQRHSLPGLGRAHAPSARAQPGVLWVWNGRGSAALFDSWVGGWHMERAGYLRQTQGLVLPLPCCAPVGQFLDHLSLGFPTPIHRIAVKIKAVHKAYVETETSRLEKSHMCGYHS